MADRKKNPCITTPTLFLKWPRLTEPDFKFNKEFGEYSTKGLGDPDDAKIQAFVKKLDTLLAEAVQQVREEKKDDKKFLKNMKSVAPYRMEQDKEGEETGKMEFSFSVDAGGTIKNGPKKGEKFTRKVALFDAKGNPVPKTTRIGAGTEAKISFEYYPTIFAKDSTVHLKRKLVAVQIIKLVEWSSTRDASDYGFEDEEGYSVSESAETAVSTGVADAGDDDTDTGNAGDF